MYRIDDATAATSLPAPEAASTEGYFTEGNPATGTPATKVRGSWLNMVQEELRGVVTAAGLTPSKTNYMQVAAAVKALIAGAAQGINSPGKINGVNSANLLFNGSGEFGNAGWNLAANFQALNDSAGAVGGYFGNTSPLSNASGSNFTLNISVAAGVQITLSFEAVSSVSAGNYSVAIVAYNSSGSFIGNVAAATVPNGASTSAQYSAAGTTPAGTAYVTVSFNITGVSAPAYGVIWRRVKVEKGNTPSLYSQEANFAALGVGPNSAPVFVGQATQSGHAVQRSQSIGNGATALSTPSRVVGTTYTNSTGRPLFIMLSVGSGNGNGTNGSGFGLSINGTVVASLFGPITSGISISGTISAIVPVGATYVLNNTGLGVGFVGSWTEY